MKERIEKIAQGGVVLGGASVTMPAANHTQSLEVSIVGWIVAAAGTLILFLLSLGVKDIRDRIKASEELCNQIKLLEYRIKQLEDGK